ncbi:inorganic diphosphatase [Candidatus Parcubacteria bacterium]|nr:inorganic diphosphatase [Candidatus Parcubacteria bacterium]
MKYKAIIEIPKGSDRRIHMKYDRSGFEDFGPIQERIPVNKGIMPVAYGYIENTINKTEKDNVDVIVFSEKQLHTGDEIDISIIGLLNRKDGDHKVIGADDSMQYQNFLEVPESERSLILDYFSYTHQITIEDQVKALEYLAQTLI